MNAPSYLLWTGCPWRYLPGDQFPPRSMVYNTFRRFQRDGVGGPASAGSTPLRRAWLDQSTRRKSSCNRLPDMVEAAHAADWENIMTRLKTDLQAWLGSLGNFLATETHDDLADAEGRAEPGQINQ